MCAFNSSEYAYTSRRISKSVEVEPQNSLNMTLESTGQSCVPGSGAGAHFWANEKPVFLLPYRLDYTRDVD